MPFEVETLASAAQLAGLGKSLVRSLRQWQAAAVHAASLQSRLAMEPRAAPALVAELARARAIAQEWLVTCEASFKRNESSVEETEEAEDAMAAAAGGTHATVEHIVAAAQGRWYFACYCLEAAEGYHGYAKVCCALPLTVWDADAVVAKTSSGPYDDPMVALVAAWFRAESLVSRKGAALAQRGMRLFPGLEGRPWQG